MSQRLRRSIVTLVAAGGTAAIASAVALPAASATPAAWPPATASSPVATSAETSQAGALPVTALRCAKPSHQLRYRWARVAPARLPDGSRAPRLSEASGIDDRGRVAGIVFRGSTDTDMTAWSFVGNEKSARWLDASGLGGQSALASAISPRGQAVGTASAGQGFVLSWAPNGKRTKIKTPARAWSVPTAVNSHGVLAGMFFSQDGAPGVFYGRPGQIKPIALPRPGYPVVTGISEDGRAVGALEQLEDANGAYPIGIVFTQKRMRMVKSPAISKVDAISPNGRYVVGRFGAKRGQIPATAAWLSVTQSPRPLKNANGFTPRDVSDCGQVVGSHRGHAASWSGSRLVDLHTRLVNKLPKGWVLDDVVAVNPRGEMAVAGRDAKGGEVALKLVPLS